MKTYTCVCGQLIFFENVACVHCKRQLGFLPDLLWLTSLDPASDDLWRPTAPEGQGVLYRKCHNYTVENVCNWMVPQTAKEETFCASCRLNEIIPDLSSELNRALWGQIENAKRKTHLQSDPIANYPSRSRKDNPQQGLSFRFLSDVVSPDGKTSKIMTGHNEGTITLNIAEADDAARETIRHAMKEPYRTLLGHFRHEIGHYYWDRLVQENKVSEALSRTIWNRTSRLHAGAQPILRIWCAIQLARELYQRVRDGTFLGRLG